MTHAVVFLLDVDNALLDNDRVIDDVRGHLVRQLTASAMHPKRGAHRRHHGQRGQRSGSGAG